MENKFDIDNYLKMSEQEGGQSQQRIPPIIYTIENKNGVYEYSNSFEINGNTSLIRLKTEKHIPLRKICKKVLIKGKDINFLRYDSANSYPSYIIDIPITEFFNRTDDLTVELDVNSKIEVTIFLENLKKIKIILV